MTNRSAYKTLVDFLKSDLRDRIRDDGLHSVADRLNLLPVGVEVILHRDDWTIEQAMDVASALNWRISFEVH